MAISLLSGFDPDVEKNPPGTLKHAWLSSWGGLSFRQQEPALSPTPPPYPLETLQYAWIVAQRNRLEAKFATRGLNLGTHQKDV